MSKKTIVLGASNNPSRYSNKAVLALLENGHEVVPIGIKKAMVHGIKIINDMPEISDIDTVTLYLGPNNQVDYYKYILDISPSRIIFNPGTENDELKTICEQKGINCVENCTLVMLNQDIY